ncbi:MoaD/ThiS family protein [Desulfofundulus thermocisternus]|uniref:MoaD/ThiS family protein n=1 Tax=Desulfofundulus thermocisternus TaxID=42471 RepID=UPI00217D6D3B|nr:MoaD/ThiS family protein [Desulfofundulus thermocisternus]MCS5695920.1 MoaD/ThiS family protein [Desulfofundulus thermocisternus]
MIAITVRLELTFAKFRPRGEKETTIELPEGATVLTLLQYLGVPYDGQKLIVKNGKVASLEEDLCHGDVICILPVMEGG